MKNNFWILIVLLGLAYTSCSMKEENKYVRGLNPTETVAVEGVRVNVYDFRGLEPLFTQHNDTLYVINFWATWCKPCVKELPYFESIRNENILLPIKVILISLDFREQLETHLIPFLVKRKIMSEVMVLHDPDANTWIDKIDPEWSGSIPATLFIKGSSREFYEKSFSYEELNKIIESKLIQI